MIHKKAGLRACLLVALLLFESPSADAAPNSRNFYTLNNQWERTAASGKSRKEAYEESFRQALGNVESPAVVPPPPPKRIILSDVARDEKLISIELNQALYVEAKGIVKFVSMQEGVVAMDTVDPNILRVVGTQIGETFLHIWDTRGRQSFPLFVTQPTIHRTRAETREREALEKSRSFQFRYGNSESAFYTADKAREFKRSSMDFNQNFSLTGDTPYGGLTADVSTQKFRGKTLLNEASLNLKDGLIGSYRNFNLSLGDSRAKSNFMVFPEARIRGAAIEHWDSIDRVKWSAFHGKEQPGILGTLSPGLISKRSSNSYLSGGVIDFKIAEQKKIRMGAFSASGRARPDNLNRKGLGLQADMGLGPHVKFNPEVDFDNERFVQRHSLTTKFEKFSIKTEFRNIEKKFVTLIGQPSALGEIGTVVSINAAPSDRVSFSGRYDIFQDRFIPNPAHPHAFNKDLDLSLSFYPWDRSSLLVNYQDFDDTGRLGPTRQMTIGTQLNQNFPLWGHSTSVFTRLQKRQSTALTNSLSNYFTYQVILGLQTEIFWGIIFSVQKEMNFLREIEVANYTRPAALTYSFDYSRQVGDTPFFMDANLRFRDEEETEPVSSFMAGEDTTEISGSLFYRGFENIELFVTGRFQNFVPESLNVLSPHVEANFSSGMRYLFDTGYYWSGEGSFEGYVFKDMNQDGVRQPEETGIPGVGIRTGDGKEAVSDTQGFYRLKSIKGKIAVLTIDSSKLPYGYTVTTSARRQAPIVNKGTERVDFGAVPRADITGIVFHDLDGNGKYDLTDAGISKVKLYLENGKAVGTNSLGVYFFPNVVAGEHTVALDVSTLPDGYLPVNVPKKQISLFEGIRYQFDFPVKANRIVTGRVYVDENWNGVLDEKEPGMPGATVTLGNRKARTDKDGWYFFDELIPGSFDLTVDAAALPAGLRQPEKGAVSLSEEPATLTKNLRLVKGEKPARSA